MAGTKKFMKKLVQKIGINFFLTFLMWAIIFNVGEAEPREITPHIFVEEVEKSDWYLNGNDEIIFVGYGSPLFPKSKSHYLDYKSIKYGDLKDGRFIITCKFYDKYEFAIFYERKPGDDKRRARFMMRDTVDTNTNPLEVDSVLAEFNGQYLEAYPPLGKNLIPNRVAEMLYYMVKGEKFYGDFDPELFIDDTTHKNIVNPYTQDLYDRCKVTK